MAAYVVAEVPPGDDKTYFTGSSREDMEYAKTFWKSIQLNPAIESRLVSSDIRQRIPPAVFKAPEPTKFKFREEDPMQLKQYFAKVQVQESMDALAKRMKSLDRRSEDIDRLKKRKASRFMVQQASLQPSVESQKSMLPRISHDSYDAVLDPAEGQEQEATETMRALSILYSKSETDSD